MSTGAEGRKGKINFMKKLLVFESISIDGYFVDAHGDMDWAHRGRDDPEFADWVSGNASAGGALLFGRKTYQMMEAFWSQPGECRLITLVEPLERQRPRQGATMLRSCIVDILKGLPRLDAHAISWAQQMPVVAERA